MADKKVVETVKGGLIARDARTGRVVEVKNPTGSSKASKLSILAVKEASNKRSAALKRLVNR